MAHRDTNVSCGATVPLSLHNCIFYTTVRDPWYAVQNRQPTRSSAMWGIIFFPQQKENR